jgi:TM2 domain-containing membrane protein YozV
MYCRSCDTELINGAVACTKCGLAPLNGSNFCGSCGQPTNPDAIMCTSCGAGLTRLPYGGVAQSSNRVTAGVCGLLLGALGIHKFILGYQKEGIIMLLISVLGSFLTFGLSAAVMGIIGLIEGIIYLTKSDVDFVNTYVVNHKGWF